MSTVTITCPSQPSLSISHLGVHFVDGTAEVDAALLEELAAYRCHGVILPGDPTPDGDAGDPATAGAGDDSAGTDDAEADTGEAGEAAKPKRASSKPFG